MAPREEERSSSPSVRPGGAEEERGFAPQGQPPGKGPRGQQRDWKSWEGWEAADAKEGPESQVLKVQLGHLLETSRMSGWRGQGHQTASREKKLHA